jgi:hypothetical protein
MRERFLDVFGRNISPTLPRSPQSTVLHLVAEDFDTTTDEWVDREQGFIFSSLGSPELVGDAINGNPAVRYDGNSAGHYNSSFTIQQPYAKIAVFKFRTVNGSTSQYVTDSLNEESRGVLGHRDGRFGMWSNKWITGNSVGTSWIIGTAIYDNPNSELYRNTEVEATGESGADDMDGMAIAVNHDLDSRWGPIDLAELLVLGNISDVALAEEILNQEYAVY